MRPAATSARTGVGSTGHDVADQADVDGQPVDDRVGAGGGEQAGVLPGQADRVRRRAR